MLGVPGVTGCPSPQGIGFASARAPAEAGFELYDRVQGGQAPGAQSPAEVAAALPG